jgi:hypothetical protein
MKFDKRKKHSALSIQSRGVVGQGLGKPAKKKLKIANLKI